MEGSRYDTGVIMNSIGGGVGKSLAIKTTHALVNQYKSFYGNGFYDNWFSFMTKRLAKVNSSWNQEHSSFSEFRECPRKVTFNDTVVCYDYKDVTDAECTESENEVAVQIQETSTECSLDLNTTFVAYEVEDGLSDSNIRFFDLPPTQRQTPVQPQPKEKVSKTPRQAKSVHKSQSLDNLLPTECNNNSEDFGQQQKEYPTLLKTPITTCLMKSHESPQTESEENIQIVEKSVSDTSVVDRKQSSRKKRVCTPRFVNRSMKSNALIIAEVGESLLEDSQLFYCGAGEEDKKVIANSKNMNTKKSEDETDLRNENRHIVECSGDCIPVHTSVKKIDLLPNIQSNPAMVECQKIKANISSVEFPKTSISPNSSVESPKTSISPNSTVESPKTSISPNSSVESPIFNLVAEINLPCSSNLHSQSIVSMTNNAPSKKVVRVSTPRVVKHSQEVSPAIVIEIPTTIDTGRESLQLHPATKKQPVTTPRFKVVDTNSLKSDPSQIRKTYVKKEGVNAQLSKANIQKEGQRLFNEIKTQISKHQVNKKVLSTIFNKKFMALLTNDYTAYGTQSTSPSSSSSTETLRLSEKSPRIGASSGNVNVSKWASRPVAQKKPLGNKTTPDTPVIEKTNVNKRSNVSTPRKSTMEVKEKEKVTSARKPIVKKKVSKTVSVDNTKPKLTEPKISKEVEKNVCQNNTTYTIDSKQPKELVIDKPRPSVIATKIPKIMSARAPEIKKELSLPKAKPVRKVTKSVEVSKRVVSEPPSSSWSGVEGQKKVKGTLNGDDFKSMKISVGISVPSKHPLEYSTFERWLSESRKYGVNGGLSNKKPVSSSAMSVGDERELKILRSIKRNPQLLEAYTTYKYGGPLAPSQVNDVMRNLM